MSDRHHHDRSVGMLTPVKQEPSAVLAVTFHLALLIAFSWFAFGHNPGRLFIGNDGPMLLSLVRHQLDFFGATPDLHTSFLQGIGNLTFPINLSFMPGYWLPTMDSAGHFMPAPIYTWFACLMFVTVLLVGWNYRFPHGVTYASAWLLTILMLPYFENYFRIYAVTSSSAFFIWYMFTVAIADIGVQRMGHESWRATIFYGGVLFLGIFLMLAASPAAVILIVPFLAVSFLVSLWRSTRDVRIRKLAAAGGVFAICAALGWVEYVAGVLLYSSSGFFLNDLMDSYSPLREFSSILFQGHRADRAFGPVLFFLATFGAGWALYTKEERLRIPAIVTLAGQILHAGIAAQLLRMSGGWSGPPPIYVEMTFFALYALFAIFALASFMQHHVPPLPHKLPILLVTVMTCILFIQPATPGRNLLQSFAMPPAASVITDLLEKEIPALPGSAFNGRVASILPSGINAQMRYAYHLNVLAGNDHQTDGLWLHNIPTLHEYNQIITPAFYRIVRPFLTLPNDKQNRSWTNFSYIDQRILRMLGVRYLLTVDATRDGAAMRAKLELPGTRTLYLLELPDANTGGKSADKIIAVDSVQAAEKIMASADFDLHTAIVFSPIGEKMRPVEESTIGLERGGYRIRAVSRGKSMLIVPIEFSRCMEITPVSGTAPQAVRVNIALTGLVFERQMDILLATQIGPFRHPRCRLEDVRDFKAIWKE